MATAATSAGKVVITQFPEHQEISLMDSSHCHTPFSGRAYPETTVMLLAIDFYEYLIDEECVTISSVTQIESIIELDSVADDVRRKSVALICLHWPILTKPLVKLALPSKQMLCQILVEMYNRFFKIPERDMLACVRS